MTATPYGEDHLAPAFISLLLSLYDEEVVRGSFKEETGIDIEDIVSARGINAMIDESTGRTEDALIKWADWVAINYWGIEK